MTTVFEKSLRDAAPAEAIIDALLKFRLDTDFSGLTIIKKLGIVTPDRSLRNALEDHILSPPDEYFNWRLFRDANGWQGIAAQQIEARLSRGRIQYDHDLGEGRTVETKFDLKTQGTGRLFVQVSTDGRPSGIEGPEGMTEIWVQMIANAKLEPCCGFLMPTRLLKEMVRSGRYPIVSTRTIEANNQGAIIPLEAIIDRMAR